MIQNGFVNLYTTDMPAALRFYAGQLGFTETFRYPNDAPEHVELRAPGIAIGLSTVDAARTFQGVDATPGAPAMCLTLWVQDLDEAFATLTADGSPVVSAPHAAGNGNRNAMLRDPDGNLVELVAKATGPSTSNHA